MTTPLTQTTKRTLSSVAAFAMCAGGSLVAIGGIAPAAHTATSAPMIPTNVTRIADTRAGLGAPDAMTNDETVTVQVTGDIATEGGGSQTVVPAGADAVVLNMTAVAARTPGFFTAWEVGTEQPPTSNINFTAGGTVANGATIPLSEDGKIAVFSRGSADLLLDVAGLLLRWHLYGSPGAAGARYAIVVDADGCRAQRDPCGD